ncbi:hypothetical protein [Haliovirga abyssi]|uniref:Uncharacterized protein n=1 Tax=Haliovirga abyssi TaxID=2996794 RepID=A0AAU9DBB2_9FUSO|nr:hypothetical protein [Haliovirga abyssi]BDU49487.1 hypothetical protein HLVA_00560 [Haliovirga abyssi]
MKNKIIIKKIWNDDDVIEFEIYLIDENFKFRTTVYTGNFEISETYKKLIEFGSLIPNKKSLIELGGFGEKYANGAISLELQCNSRGIIHLEIEMETEFYEFNKRNISDKLLCHKKTDPALYDKFVKNFKRIEKFELGEEIEFELI